jgi:hypothetical protein
VHDVTDAEVVTSEFDPRRVGIWVFADVIDFASVG